MSPQFFAEIGIVRPISAAERMVAHELRHRARLVRRIEGCPRALGHAGRLEQVLLNLIVNAVHAFPESAEDPRIEIRCATQGRHVELVVEDNAGGIPEEQIRLVTYGNPLAAYGQSGQLDESHWLSPPAIDQRTLYMGNSILRGGQSPRIDEGLSRGDDLRIA